MEILRYVPLWKWQVRDGLSDRRYSNGVLKKEREQTMLMSRGRASAMSRANSNSKGPEVRACWECARNGKEAREVRVGETKVVW